MAGKKRDKITERDIDGLKYFDKLGPLLARLHEDGCGRDKAGNRHRSQVGDWSIFRLKNLAMQARVPRKHGPVPLKSRKAFLTFVASAT